VDVAVEFGHKGDSGRKDTCWGLSCDCPRQNAILACKFGRARWNIRWKIATEDAGSTGPGMCELACRSRREATQQAILGRRVASSSSRAVAAGITSESQWQAGETEGKSMFLARRNVS
jgi:hypothetical protein